MFAAFRFLSLSSSLSSLFFSHLSRVDFSSLFFHRLFFRLNENDARTSEIIISREDRGRVKFKVFSCEEDSR